MLLDGLSVILNATRFPENIGMVARACANMGCHNLRLAKPERADPVKAAPLATRAGMPVLANARIFADLDAALADQNLVYGTTARLGGWRKTVLDPGKAAAEICSALADGSRVALLFGPEDKGLSNQEIRACAGLIHIPTAENASSLNLAQAVLLVLYECARSARKLERNSTQYGENLITLAEMSLLEKRLAATLTELDCLQGQNPDYFFIQWHNILARSRLRRHEFDALMGFCRQIHNKLGRKSPFDNSETPAVGE